MMILIEVNLVLILLINIISFAHAFYVYNRNVNMVLKENDNLNNKCSRLQKSLNSLEDLRWKQIDPLAFVITVNDGIKALPKGWEKVWDDQPKT